MRKSKAREIACYKWMGEVKLGLNERGAIVKAWNGKRKPLTIFRRDLKDDMWKTTGLIYPRDLAKGVLEGRYKLVDSNGNVCNEMVFLELFSSDTVCKGKRVMIVNNLPWPTGYDFRGKTGIVTRQSSPNWFEVTLDGNGMKLLFPRESMRSMA